MEETLQNASLKFLQDLIHQKQFEEFKQALTLVKIANNLKLLQLNLRFAIATKNDKNEESLDKVRLPSLMLNLELSLLDCYSNLSLP
jgi:ribosomal protein L29